MLIGQWPTRVNTTAAESIDADGTIGRNMKAFASVVLATLLALVSAQGLSTTPAPHDPCRTCQILIGIARHYLNNTVNNQAQLQQVLLAECQQLGNHGFSQPEIQGCIAQVNAKIGDIYSEMHDHPTDTNMQVCQHIGDCPMMKRKVSLKRKVASRKIARTVLGELCSICEEVFKSINSLLPEGEDLTEDALKEILDGLCDEIPFVSSILKGLVNKYLDEIFQYIKEQGTIDAQTLCKMIDCC
uniref:Saposin B-type domain-containing protein n=1 Tax=Plectus sambesii TaxID=2011161 RepID=A0A914W276_9BILA